MTLLLLTDSYRAATPWVVGWQVVDLVAPSLPSRSAASADA